MVVPWVMGTAGSSSIAGSVRPSLPRRWTKLGPGSSSGGKSGSVMTTRRLAGAEHVAGGRGQQFGVVVEVPEGVVAAEAQQAAHPAGAVLVVDVEGDAGVGLPTADGAAPTLLGQQAVVVLGGDPELPPQVPRPLLGLHIRSLPSPALVLVVALGIGLLPRLHPGDLFLPVGVVPPLPPSGETRLAVTAQAVLRSLLLVELRLREVPSALGAASHGRMLANVRSAVNRI